MTFDLGYMASHCMAKQRRKALIGVVIGFVFCCWILLIHSRGGFLLECSDTQSMKYLDDLCANYSKGVLTGSLCAPLCTRNEIKFTRCLGHGVKVHVLNAIWKDTRVVLKAKRTLNREVGVEHALLSLPNEESFDEKTFSLSRDKFIKYARYALYDEVPADANQDSVTRVIKHIFSECDVGHDDVLWFEETVSCWHLLEAHEYLLYQILNGNSAVPQVLGVCGNLYAVQYAPSEPFLGKFSDWAEVRDWSFRAQLALALLEMVESLENTEMGTVYLCDVQESNFGVVSRQDGSLVAKAIDMDISYFEHYLISTAKSEQNHSCTSDKDCTFFSCQIKCDMSTKRCAGVLSSNNFRSMCVLLFKQRYPHHPALLMRPPREISARLNQLLEQCSLSESPHIDWNVLKKLRSLLVQSTV